MLTTMPLAPGDIVVLGSDGLWDNVSEDELLAEVERDVLEGGHGRWGGWGEKRGCRCVCVCVQVCCRRGGCSTRGAVGTAPPC